MIKKSIEFSYKNKKEDLTLKFTLDLENVAELKDFKKMLEQATSDVQKEIEKADVL